MGRDPGGPQTGTGLAEPASGSRPGHPSELLLKLTLMERAGINPQELLEAHDAQLVPVAERYLIVAAMAGG